MSVLSENLKVALQSKDPSVVARYPEWMVDAAVGAFLDPSDAILVTGFWRSGTTWLMESLARSTAAKSVFEPLLPHIPGYERHFYQRYDLAGNVKEGGLMPYCSTSLSEFPGLEDHLRRALSGALPGFFVREARSSIREKRGMVSNWRIRRVIHRLENASRRQVVVKSVRAHLLLPVLISELRPLVIHVRRDPRAVVASYRRQPWTAWMRDASLSDLLLTPDDGRRNHFLRWESQIRQCDATGYVSKIAGYWALAEKFVDQVRESIVLVRYEDLCRGLSRSLNDLLSVHTDLTVSDEDLVGESHTSGRSSDNQVERRIYGWKEELNNQEVEEVERVAECFGMEATLSDS